MVADGGGGIPFARGWPSGQRGERHVGGGCTRVHAWERGGTVVRLESIAVQTAQALLGVLDSFRGVAFAVVGKPRAPALCPFSRAARHVIVRCMTVLEIGASMMHDTVARGARREGDRGQQ